MENWYVMSVGVGKERAAVESIRSYSGENGIENISPFVPTREKFFRSGGVTTKETAVLFPGYVFAETSMNAYDFLSYASSLRRRMSGYLTVLSYGESSEIALRRDEQLALMQFMNGERCFEASLGFRENDVITVVEGPLVGYEGLIRKIDIHKMRVVIEVAMFDRVVLLEVGLQLIARKSQAQ